MRSIPPNRSLLDAVQRQWLYDGLSDSRATWQVLGQQVLMARQHLPEPAQHELEDGNLDRGIELFAAIHHGPI